MIPCNFVVGCVVLCCVVPKGSILGPKLFIMYINDISNVLKHLKFILFADDMNMFLCNMNMFYCNNDINELIRQENAELDKLNMWFLLNKLSLNITKTNYMIFRNRALNQSIHKRCID